MTSLGRKPTTFNYVVSASRETVIHHSITGSFTAEDAIDVICDKGTRVEVRTLRDNDRLEVVASLPVYGRVSALRLIRPLQDQQQKDWLFVLTNRYHYYILAYENGKIQEKSSGDLSERVGQKNNTPIVAVDPKSRFIVCYLFSGLLTVIVFDPRTGGVKESPVMPLEELQVLDLCFSNASGKTLLCVLYQDNRQARNLRTYEILPKTYRELKTGSWTQPNVDPTANKLLPVNNGVIIFSATSLVHLRETGGDINRATTTTTGTGAGGGGASQQSQSGSISDLTPMPTTLPIMCGNIEAVGLVEKDGSRILLGDEYGGLHVLSITHIPNQSNVTLTIEMLGETSLATGLCYLDAGVVFIASHAGDSQLVRLLPERDEASQSYIELLESFHNLGPITSMCVVDVNKQGRGQLVTCSGAKKDGSLRVIRNGVGVDDQCSVDLPGIKGMWSVKHTYDARFDSYLIQSFSTETRVFGFDEDSPQPGNEEVDGNEQSLSELTTSPCFDTSGPTLYCGNVAEDVICQVTPSRVRLMRCAALSSSGLTDSALRVYDWSPPAGARITVASRAVETDGFVLVVALTGGKVILLQGSVDTFNVTEFSTQFEVACLASAHGFLVVGLWTDLCVRIIEMSTGREVHCERSFGEDALPRSVVITRFGSDAKSLHLLVGLGDGRLVMFKLDQSTGKIQPNWKRVVALGVQPVELCLFDDPNSSSKHVFAACDRPAIVYTAANDKLLLSNVNVSMEVTRTCSFDTEQFPACLALASEERLVIGTVNDVQKLHIKTIPLGEQPRRIAHQPSSNAFAVCTMKKDDYAPEDPRGDGTDEFGPGVDAPEFPESSFVRLLDDRSFEELDSYRLDELEQAISLVSMSFQADSPRGGGDNMDVDDQGDEAKAYFVVGTAYADDEPDPTRGRILVLEVVKLEGEERRLNLVVEKSTKGAVWDLCAFGGKLLATVNAKVQLYRWNDRMTATSTGRTSGGNNIQQQDLLSQECGYHGHTLSLYVQTEGKSIVVGDLVKSLTLLEWDKDKNALEDKARDFSPSWVTAVACLDEKTFLSSDTQLNIRVLKPLIPARAQGVTEDEYGKLEVDADFHWGDFINVFAKGTLVMRTKQEDEEPAAGVSAGITLPGSVTIKAQPKLLFGTAGGAIGVLATLTEKEFILLDRLQVALNEVVPFLGDIKGKFLGWRAFSNEKKTHPSSGFIDGDLVEMVLELNNSDIERVVELMNKGLSDKTGSVTTDEPPRIDSAQLVALVEDLARLH